jgi:hypothetical protein
MRGLSGVASRAVHTRHALADADGIRTLLSALTKARADLDAEPHVRINIKGRTIVGLVVLAIAGATLAVAEPASAAPTGCGPGWAGEGNTYATAWCSGGTGTFNVSAQCRSTVWPYGYSFVESSWRRPGGTALTNSAWVQCSFPSTVVTWGIGRRN